MRYVTPRKRAEGRGAGHAGTEHHWSMTVSAVGLAFLVPVWLYVFGRALGQSREVVVETFGSPFPAILVVWFGIGAGPAILTALVLVVGMRHFAMGATTMIEDYARGTSRKMLIIFVVSLSWVIAATGLFALARMASWRSSWTRALRLSVLMSPSLAPLRDRSGGAQR